MSWDPSDAIPDNPPCPHCRGLGFLPRTHDRGEIECGYCGPEPADEAEDDQEEAA